MANVVTDAEARDIAQNAAAQEKALAVLRGARSNSLIYALLPVLVACFVVRFTLSGLQMAFWSRVVISAGCILAFSAFVAISRIQRHLLAAIDLLLLREGERR